MSRSALRTGLYALGGLLLAAAVVSVLAGRRGAWPLAIPGLILILALAIERWRYRRLDDPRPGPDWTDTGERFIDPETGRLVAVYYRPTTGERRYVTTGPDAPTNRTPR